MLDIYDIIKRTDLKLLDKQRNTLAKVLMTNDVISLVDSKSLLNLEGLQNFLDLISDYISQEQTK